MNDLQTTGQDFHGDPMSVFLAFGYIILQIGQATIRTEASFWMAMSVGSITILYNSYKFYNEYQDRRSKRRGRKF